MEPDISGKKITIKGIKVDINKCVGCRICELVCSFFHTQDTYNPRQSRIRVFSDDEVTGLSFPIRCTQVVEKPCPTKTSVVINEAEFDACSLCMAACPSRELFRDPVTKKILRCDLCGGDPSCVKWCPTGTLTIKEAE